MNVAIAQTYCLPIEFCNKVSQAVDTQSIVDLEALHKGGFVQYPIRRLLTRDPRETTHSLGSLEIPTAPCRVEKLLSAIDTYF